MILFRHAQIYDGTGQKPLLGDVLVRNDRIAEVGKIWRCRKIQKFWRQTASCSAPALSIFTATPMCKRGLFR